MSGGASSQEKGIFSLVGGQREVFKLMGIIQALNINEVKECLIDFIIDIVELVDRPIRRLQAHDQGPNGFSTSTSSSLVITPILSQPQIDQAKALSDFHLPELPVFAEEWFVAFVGLRGIHELGVLAGFVEVEHEELLVFRHEEKGIVELLRGKWRQIFLI